MSAGSRGEDRLCDAETCAELVAEALAGGSPLRFVTRGGSMSPFLRPGDRVTVEPLSPSRGELRVGDVVTFRDPHSDRIFVHRLLSRRAGGWIAQGDRNPFPDGLIGDPLLLGRVTAVERGGRGRFLPRGRLGVLLARVARALLEVRARLAAPRPG